MLGAAETGRYVAKSIRVKVDRKYHSVYRYKKMKNIISLIVVVNFLLAPTTYSFGITNDERNVISKVNKAG